jgi:hypothetical protein
MNQPLADATEPGAARTAMSGSERLPGSAG